MAGSTSFDRWALAQIQRHVASAPLKYQLWDGFTITSPGAPPIATIVFTSRAALVRTAWNPELNFGEGYMSGAIEVHGDLERMLESLYAALHADGRRPWRRRPRANDPKAAKANVHHHYDLGNDFYRLWLDRELVYTCAYFPSEEADLEAAQLAKMERVCRKLRLQPGERVVEAGCGWGSLALHMARRYRVSVRAFNISSEQIAYARERAQREGLGHLVEFVDDDYRNIRGSYDVFASVGMLEHVGLQDFDTFGRVIDRSLGVNGRGLLHFIGRNQAAPLNAWIAKRIFPGGYTPVLREVFERTLEPYALSVLDVENLRPHYARTLAHWRCRFLAVSAQVRSMFDDSFVRAWDLYLAGSQAAFATGWMQLFQVVFARGESNAIPWSRG